MVAGSAFVRPEEQVVFCPLERVYSLHNGKGGVGKTSVATNLSVESASIGLNVLVVDLDPGGSLYLDLGYAEDDGTAMLNALMTGAPFTVTRGVRPNLDVVRGGEAMKNFLPRFLAESFADPDAPRVHERLWASLAPVVEDGAYDLVFIDTPPNEEHLTIAAMSLSTAVLIPSTTDDGSTAAVTKAAKRFVKAMKFNPELALAGAVLFNIKAGARRTERELREALSEIVGNDSMVFPQRIREATTASRECRKYGLAARELVTEMRTEAAERISALKAGKAPASTRFRSTNAEGLAADYEGLAKQVLHRLAEIERSRVEVAQ
jgi:chromosome partitioning protein